MGFFPSKSKHIFLLQCPVKNLLICRVDIHRAPGHSLGIGIVGGKSDITDQQIVTDAGDVIQVLRVNAGITSRKIMQGPFCLPKIIMDGHAISSFRIPPHIRIYNRELCGIEHL